MSKSLVRSIKNVANGYSHTQILVRKATSNDPSGPTTYDMEEIGAATQRSQTDFLEVMDMLDRRLNDKGKNWRHVAKSLTVLDYLVRYGSDKCVLWSKDNIYIIKTLREFIHIDETNNDQGAIVRVKAKELVSLLYDDERLRTERDAARANRGERSSRRRNGGRRGPDSANGDEYYDSELQKALEISLVTAEEENKRKTDVPTDPELQAALKLSMEEEEMRKSRQNENLLDLNDEPIPQQQYYATGYYQQPQQPQQIIDASQYQQMDMFGNPIQNPVFTGFYQQPQYYQQPQFTQNQTTGYNFGQPQQQLQQQPQQTQQQLQPLKTGSNNPFALAAEPQNTQSYDTSLNALQEEQWLQQQQQQQQLQQQNILASSQKAEIRPQTTSSSKFNDSTHADLNNLLAQGTGIDTFGNTGATRIPHQHTKTQTFINSSGTGYKQADSNVKLSSNATGNPFLNTGVGYQSTSQPQQAAINPAYTGYGFGNASNHQQPRSNNDGPSLIDI